MSIPLIKRDIFQFGQNVIGAFDEGGPLAEQLVATAREGAVDGPGYREDLPTLFCSVSGGDQRATAGGCFDDEDAHGQAAD